MTRPATNTVSGNGLVVRGERTMARSGTGIAADPRTAPDGASPDTAVGCGNAATSNVASLTATRIQEPDLVLDGAALASRPRRAADVESFWDRWGLTGAAVFCW